MQIDWWTLGLQALNALVLIWILARFFFRPVSEIMRARQEAANAILHDAEEAKKAAKLAEQKAEAETAKLADDRANLMEIAKREAEKTRESILADAREQAEKIRDDARTSADALHEKQEADLSLKAGRLAVDIAQKLLSRLPKSALVNGFIDGLEKGIASLPEETRKGIGADGKAMQLKAARALQDDEIEACEHMLQNVLGRPVAVNVTVDPELIAGLELETSHALVRNSLRSNLERIETELSQNG